MLIISHGLPTAEVFGQHKNTVFFSEKIQTGVGNGMVVDLGEDGEGYENGQKILYKILKNYLNIIFKE